MDDIVSFWNYGENELRGFLDNLNAYDRNLQFTLEIENCNKIPLLDVLTIRSIEKINLTIYRIPAQNSRYLNFKSNQQPRVKRVVIMSLVDCALIVCSGSHTTAELNFIRDILCRNGYPILFNNNTVSHKLKRHSRKINGCLNPDKSSRIIYLPYIPKILNKLALKIICVCIY